MTITKISQMIRYLKPRTTSSSYKNIYFTFNSKVKMALLFLALVLTMILSNAGNVQAQTMYCVRAGATGANNGSDWNNAYTSLPSTLVRGATYYMADGNYPAYIFDDAVTGTSVISIKKATGSDHGTATGWNTSYGDGQAVFATSVTFSTGYYTFDGNGSHTTPSNDTNNYGLKINYTGTSNHAGLVRIGSGSALSNITFKYVHVYSQYSGKDGNYDIISVRFYPSLSNVLARYVKIQNCFFENSSTDGMQANSVAYLLFERNYVKHWGLLLAGTPDYHGQAVMVYYGGSNNLVFRYNTWESCEGQALMNFDEGASPHHIRFYSNVIYNSYGYTTNRGFNSSGGIIGGLNSATSGQVNYVYVYNNTLVNIAGDYDAGGIYSECNWLMPSTSTNVHAYNNLHYNTQEVHVSGWSGYGYHASGGGENAGGTNEQTGLTSTIFMNYTGNDFRLVSPTETGLTLTSQTWWSGGANAFFGTTDSVIDMYGKTRGSDGTWDRGAYEYGSGGIQSPPNFRVSSL